MSDVAVAEVTPLVPTRQRSIAACRHCTGSGREPRDLQLIEFSRSGEQRGDLQRLSNDTGIDKSRLSRIMRGVSPPRTVDIVLIADALGVSESRLIHYPPIWHRLCQEMASD